MTDPQEKPSGSSKVWLLLTLLVLLTFTYCTYSVYTGFRDFPEWAEKDQVYAQYGAVITAVEAELEQAESLFDLAARLEKLPVANEIMYLVIEKEDLPDSSIGVDEKLVVIGDEHSSVSFFLQHHVGHGSLDGQEVAVVLLEAEHLEQVENVMIYLAR